MTLSSRRRSRHRALGALAIVGSVMAGCSTTPSAVTMNAEPATTTTAPTVTTTTPTADTTTSVDASATTEPRIEDPVTPATAPVDSIPVGGPGTTATGDTTPPVIDAQLLADIDLDTLVDVGDDKPEHDYDAFLAAALTDIAEWLTEEFPKVYDDEFEPLDDGIYAGYPDRDSDIPGCGDETTEYDELTEYVAFYCEWGDFMVYDDGENGMLAQLSEAFSPAVMGIVLAHEYGHAVQERAGVLRLGVATVITEQQADCIGGAWIGRAYRGESPYLQLGDRDVRAALVALVEVRDPVGIDQFDEGGHGTAFDRVGAFQEGFNGGFAACEPLIDAPLKMLPNEFQNTESGLNDAIRGGNAPYDCSEVPASEREFCSPAKDFLADDLNDFWSTVIPDFPEMSALGSDRFDSFRCPGMIVVAAEAVLCPESHSLVYDEPAVLDLYRDYGDFTLGYYLGIGWAEQAQLLSGSTLEGEPRALLNDCWTGAWVRDITPDSAGNVERPDSGVSASPGDLDEAIQMAILIGDLGAHVDVVGSPFEKITNFRAGVLGGSAVCAARVSR